MYSATAVMLLLFIYRFGNYGQILDPVYLTMFHYKNEEISFSCDMDLQPTSLASSGNVTTFYQWIVQGIEVTDLLGHTTRHRMFLSCGVG